MKRLFKIALLASALVALPTAASAAGILVLNGNGSNSLSAPLSAAGFTVYSDAFNPGVIASNLAAHADISQIWVWNDGTFGNSFSPAVAARAFDASDLSALVTFNSTHKGWIMDGLSWRSNGNLDEQNFSKNEALALAGFGGGIVLGADDSSGAAIVQHVNQVASLFNFNAIGGVYNTAPASQHFGGSLITAPNVVNPNNVVGTTTYSEMPNGLQPNGIFLSTVMFGQGFQNFCCGFPGPELGSQTFNGILYDHVNHVVTTSIPGGGIDPNPGGVPEPASWAMMLAGFGAAGAAMRRRAKVRVTYA